MKGDSRLARRSFGDPHPAQRTTVRANAKAILRWQKNRDSDQR